MLGRNDRMDGLECGGETKFRRGKEGNANGNIMVMVMAIVVEMTNRRWLC